MAIAAFALEALLPALPDTLEALPVVVPEAAALVFGVVPAGEEGEDATTEDTAVVGVDETDVVGETAATETDAEDAAEDAAEGAPPDGGGLASAALTSAPVPQGIA